MSGLAITRVFQSDLPPTWKHLLIRLADSADGGGFVHSHVSIPSLAWQTGFLEDAVSQAINRMHHLQLIGYYEDLVRIRLDMLPPLPSFEEFAALTAEQRSERDAFFARLEQGDWYEAGRPTLYPVVPA